MTEPNRDATNPTNPNPASASPEPPSPCAPVPPASGSPEPPTQASPSPTHKILPWSPSTLIPRPGIFTRDAVIPHSTPGASFIEAIRSLVDEDALGSGWFVNWHAPDAVRIFRGHPNPLSFEVAIQRPVNRGDDYVTTVDHEVTDPEIAAPLERILRDHREQVSQLTALFVGHVRKPVADNPFQPALLHVGIGNRWPVPPASTEENRIAEFVIWNIKVILWLRAEALQHGRNACVTYPAPQPTPSPVHRAPSAANPPASRLPLPAQREPLPEKGWEAILWPRGWDPFGTLVPWVGLCSPAVFQPLVFDTGYWFEFWTEHGARHGVTASLIETVRRALPLYLDKDWYIEYRGHSHHFLRHEKHPWIFEIRECRTYCSERTQHPVPYRIRPPGGPFCPTGNAASVRLISPSREQAESVARELCDRRAGTCDARTGFRNNHAPGEVKWSVWADLSGGIGGNPVFPWRHARPGLDASGWWADQSWHRGALLNLKVVWALKLLHESCLRHVASVRGLTGVAAPSDADDEEE